MQTSDSTRSVALLVPRLLGVQADPAEFDTSDALAEAIERSAEEILRWHDELADIRPVPARGDGPGSDDGSSSEGPARASGRLADQVRSGVIPADPASIEAAAGELHGIAATIRRVAADRDGDATGRHGARIATALADLAASLSSLAATLRLEMRRLEVGSAGGADQVLARVVRAEHTARTAAAATLRR